MKKFTNGKPVLRSFMSTRILSVLSKYPPHPAFNFETMKWRWTNFQMQVVLRIFLEKRNAYRKNFHETKYMSFLIKDDELLEKYKEIWEIVKSSTKKEIYLLICNFD